MAPHPSTHPTLTPPPPHSRSKFKLPRKSGAQRLDVAGSPGMFYVNHARPTFASDVLEYHFSQLEFHLEEMLVVDPTKRLTEKEALQRFKVVHLTQSF
ncbi:hypothetical protein BU17DRAFT_82179 [Hysterangium stoloniferum]|nr:hypothetical protein BU17DRAFT_82179 [Hysterangium stoloniferum]